MKFFCTFLLSVTAMLFSSSAAFAWNCSDPLAARVNVGTTQPSGTSGDADGQWFQGTGSEGVSGDYYVCEVPTAPADPGNKNSNKNTNSNSATGGNSSSSSSATGGNSHATGGSVNGSGNSTNTNTAQGGAGGSASSNQTQSQSSSSTSAASNNGNGSNNASYSSETNIAASKIPVATAYAPTSLPTSPCTKGFGAGVQTVPFGGSFGANIVDKNCVILEAARNAPNILTFCKVYITHKAVKAAGVTLDDCMKSYDVPAPVIKEVIREVPKEVIREVPVIKEVVKEVPAPVKPFQSQLVGICTFASGTACDPKTKALGDPLRVTTICDDMLREAIALQTENPGTIIRVLGNENDSEKPFKYDIARAKNVERRLVALGANADTIIVSTGGTGERTVEIWVSLPYNRKEE